MVDITDSKGCTTSATVTIDEPVVLAASAVQLTAITCFGADNGSAKVTATGGNLPYLYAWDDGQTAATAIGLTPVLHVVDITDSKGCTHISHCNYRRTCGSCSQCSTANCYNMFWCRQWVCKSNCNGRQSSLLVCMGRWSDSCNSYRLNPWPACSRYNR